MSEEFSKNAISDLKMMTPESIVKMTKAFNLKDFYAKGFEGMAEIIITPHQSIIVYGDNRMLHKAIMGIVSRYIIDAKVCNPIIEIYCRVEEGKTFYPELYREDKSITQDMMDALKVLYGQLNELKDNEINVLPLNDFIENNEIRVRQNLSDIPKAGLDKNIIGISIEEFIKLNQERNKSNQRKTEASER